MSTAPPKLERETEPALAGESSPAWLVWLTRISIVIGLGALIATVWFVGARVILGHLKEIGWLFVAIIATDMLSSVCDGTAVYYMSRGPGAPTWRECVVAQFAGRGVSAVTPGGNLGEPLKVGLLSKRCPPKRIVAAVMYVGLILIVFSFGVISLGTAATAFLFDIPHAGMLALLIGAAVAAGVSVTIIVLIRRGMLSTLSSGLAHLHIISTKRRAKWKKTFEEVDDRLRGHDVQKRRHAIACLALSQALQKFLTFLVVFAAGYTLSPGQFLALVSTGVLLGWISTIIPMGLGISEGGNVALFGFIGAPASLGLALAFARRVNQIVFATIGFIVLSLDRIVGRHPHGRVAHPAREGIQEITGAGVDRRAASLTPDP